MNRRYKIKIPEYEEGELYKKSMENIRIAQLKRKADIEADYEYNKKYIGSLMPREEKKTYYKQLMDNFHAWQKQRKVLKLF